ncbi:MAG: hypothetical protein WC975_01035 [Phycisphaerae bacterium]
MTLFLTGGLVVQDVAAADGKRSEPLPAAGNGWTNRGPFVMMSHKRDSGAKRRPGFTNKFAIDLGTMLAMTAR